MLIVVEVIEETLNRESVKGVIGRGNSGHVHLYIYI